MGAAVGKQFQTKSAEQRAKRSSIVVTALQSYQKEFPNERIGVENGHYDPKIFRQAVLLGIKERRYESGAVVIQCLLYVIIIITLGLRTKFAPF